MLRADFDRNLKLLQDDLIELGNLVGQAITQAMDALKNRDLAASQRVVAEDDVIDQKRFELEDQCIDLIATQQPIAIDLRTLMAVLHISVELERVGDYAEGIAKVTLMMGDEPASKPLFDLPLLADKASDMLGRSLDALILRDAGAAEQVCEDDDQVDNLYKKVYRELLTDMTRDPKSIRRATYLLWVAHDLERIADRATNIAERVIFLVTGKLPGVNQS
ncbi:MAG: phosphate signaling complex protein PhoU [Chloroflexi bacterium]|nr:phosphate signaling complex protein PhoU [Chloroflexota bacterium]